MSVRGLSYKLIELGRPAHRGQPHSLGWGLGPKNEEKRAEHQRSLLAASWLPQAPPTLSSLHLCWL